MPEHPCIELRGVTKRFGGVTALDAVSFGIRRGEVHAIVGENGAGKSTLMKLLAGVHQPDAGELRVDGRPVHLKSPRDARREGISIVFQELNLFPHRTVAANVFAQRELTQPWGTVDLPAMREATRRVLDDLAAPFSPDALVGSLSMGERQLVEIARTLDQQARIIILDEPNSALSEAESQRLFDLVRRLRFRGMTILYVSHRLEEVFALADQITVLRDGRFQSTRPVSQTTIPAVIAEMIGRSVEDLFPAAPAGAGPGPVVLEVRELSQTGRLGPVSFCAGQGEIVGFAGLEGAGVDELFRILFGLSPRTGGTIHVRGEPYDPGSPGAAIRAGLGLIPESRREQGLMMEASIARNGTLLVLEQLRTRLGLVDGGAVARMADQFIQRLGIRCDSRDKQVALLSGGNQQKVLLAKWLAIGPSILILNDPTRGVDVGAKREIYELIRKLAADGMTLLITSSEIEEILGLSDRIVVMARGGVVGEFPARAADKAQLMAAMTGGIPGACVARPGGHE